MKKIILIFTLFVSIILLNQAYAQKVGYQGKRFLFNFDSKLNIELEDFDLFDFEFKPNFLFSFSPNIEYIILKNSSIGLAANFFTDNITVNYLNQDYFDLPFTVVGGGIFYKHYLNRRDDFYQAPFGVYLNFRFDYLKYYLEFPTFVYDNFVLGTRVELGVDYLIFDRVRLSWGISLGLSSSFLNEYYPLFDIYESDIARTLNNETSRRYGLQHKFGIGILLF